MTNMLFEQTEVRSDDCIFLTSFGHIYIEEKHLQTMRIESKGLFRCKS